MKKWIGITVGIILAISFILLLIPEFISYSLETGNPDVSVMRLIEDNDSSVLISSASDIILGKVKLDETPFAALKPMNIEIYDNELKLILNEAGRMENGIIIYISYPDHIKKEYEKSGEFYQGGSGYYENSIVKGIHWYWEKNRMPMK